MSDKFFTLIVTAALAQCQALVDTNDVSDENPYAAMERLGLQKVTTTLP